MNYPIPDQPPDDDEYFFYEEMRPIRPDIPEQEFPRSVDAERAIISAILQWPEEILPEVINHGGQSLFYLLTHRLIFQCIEDLANASIAIDLVTVTDALRESHQLRSVGGPAQLAEMFCEVPCKMHFRSWLELLRDYHVKRELIKICWDTRDFINRDRTAVPDLLNQVEMKLEELRSMIDKPNETDSGKMFSTYSEDSVFLAYHFYRA